MLLHFKHADRSAFTPLLICPEQGEVSRQAELLGIETLFFSWPPVCPLRFILAARRLRAICARNQVKIIHADTLELGVLAGLAAMFSPIKTVFHARVGDSGGLWDKIIPFFSDRIICVSRAAARRFPNSGKVRVIYNGVEKAEAPLPEETARLRRALGLAPENVVIGYCGQLVEGKGLPTLLRAFALLKSKYQQARLLISGRGTDAELKALASELGIGRETIFSGFQTEHFAVRACIDIFTLPGTLAEGLPRSILEGMALGRPAVLTPCGGSAETIIDGESGFFAPPTDHSALAEKLGLLLEDAALRQRMGEAAKKRMLEFFEINKATRAIETAYKELAS